MESNPLGTVHSNPFRRCTVQQPDACRATSRLPTAAGTASTACLPRAEPLALPARRAHRRRLPRSQSSSTCCAFSTSSSTPRPLRYRSVVHLMAGCWDGRGQQERGASAWRAGSGCGAGGGVGGAPERRQSLAQLYAMLRRAAPRCRAQQRELSAQGSPVRPDAPSKPPGSDAEMLHKPANDSQLAQGSPPAHAHAASATHPSRQHVPRGAPPVRALPPAMTTARLQWKYA